jgi:hypothetical protein
MSFGKHYLAIQKAEWRKGVLSGHFKTAWDSLSFEDIEPTWENFQPLVAQIKTGLNWADLDCYQAEAMKPVFANPQTRLLLLKKGDEPVGYSLITRASPVFIDRFNAASNDNDIVQIENLALFPGQRGSGMGKAFFEMVFQDLFERNNTICWSTSDFNANTLVKFYKDEMRMTVLGYDAPAERKFG